QKSLIEEEDEDYSIWTVPQKQAILLSGSLLGWFSPMTASMYYPATAQIAGDLGVSVSKINLTVTTYLIIQGLAPMMIAGFSDKAGRRPAYIICFTIYMIANLALALQDNHVALLVLRMLQSAGE
ncbi:MFS general substrate transporter, partial [Lepidopterella palustris CBS 459.81]